jgi:putative ABC transport system permease protein
MNYALSTIWYERHRFLPAVFAVAFAAVLIAVQTGLTLGLFSTVSVPVDKSRADIWVGYPGVRSVDLGRPIPERWASRVAADPAVDRVESCVVGFAIWIPAATPTAPGVPEVVTVVGARLAPDSLGAVEYLRDHPDLMARLTEPNTVAVDESEFRRLGLTKFGDQAEVAGRLVRVVGVVKGYKSIGGPYVFASLETARTMLRDPAGTTTYVLAKCKDPADAPAVARRLGRYRQMSAFTG